MKKSCFNRTVKVTSLLLAVIVAVSALQTKLLRHWEGDVPRVAGFRLEEKDSLDVVFLGASDIYTGFSSPYAYELQGITSYPYAISACPATFWKMMLEETLSRQSPQLIVVEISGALYKKPMDLHSNAVLHYLLDDMPLSFRKIKNVCEQCDLNTDSGWYFLFPLLKYHSGWQDVTRMESAIRNRADMERRGYALLRGVSSKAVVSPPEGGSRDVAEDYSEADLAEDAEQYLIEFLEYCRGKGLNVLFTRFPQQIGKADAAAYDNFRMTNRAERIIREYGFPFLNLERRAEEIGIDPNVDYLDHIHLNLSGQRKLTAFLTEYMVHDCKVVSRVQSAENESRWNASVECYELFCDYVDNQQQEGNNNWLSESADTTTALEAMKMGKTHNDPGEES